MKHEWLPRCRQVTNLKTALLYVCIRFYLNFVQPEKSVLGKTMQRELLKWFEMMGFNSSIEFRECASLFWSVSSCG